MRTISVPDDRRTLLLRLARLRTDSPALWGRMNASQMLCHLGDQVRIPLREVDTPGKAPFLTRTLLKWLVLGGLPIPKGKAPTFPSIDQVAGNGTKPASLETDLAVLEMLIDRFLKTSGSLPTHPVFGLLDKKQWARLIWIHIDHHARQFGL